MSLTKQSEINQITINKNGVILIVTLISILEDGVQIANESQNSLLLPGQDISNQPENVQAIANTAWTPEIIAQYKASNLAA